MLRGNLCLGEESRRHTGNGNKVASLNANRFWKRSNEEYKGRTRVKGMAGDISAWQIQASSRCDRCSASPEFRLFYTIQTQKLRAYVLKLCEWEKNFHTYANL